MASVNVSEEDFGALSAAANAAQRRGDLDSARALDKIARKMNAALSNSRKLTGGFRASRGLSWTEVPSTLLGGERDDG